MQDVWVSCLLCWAPCAPPLALVLLPLKLVPLLVLLLLLLVQHQVLFSQKSPEGNFEGLRSILFYCLCCALPQCFLVVPVLCGPTTSQQANKGAA